MLVVDLSQPKESSKNDDPDKAGWQCRFVVSIDDKLSCEFGGGIALLAIVAGQWTNFSGVVLDFKPLPHHAALP